MVKAKISINVQGFEELEEVYVKPIPWDPRQQDNPLQLQVAALRISPSSSSLSLEEDDVDEV